MLIRVVTFKAAPPFEGGELVAQQMQSAHRYYNKLVEIERDFTQEREAAKKRHCPDLVQTEAAVEASRQAKEAASKAVSAANAARRSRKKTPESAALAASLKEAKQAFTAACNANKAARAVAITNAAYQAELAQLVVKYQGEVDPDSKLGHRRGGRMKEARKNSGLYWGTYQLIEQAFEAAKKDSQGRPIRFRRWDGSGRVGLQVIGGCTVQKLFSEDSTLCRLQRIPMSAEEVCRVQEQQQRQGHQPSKRSRRSERYEAWLRVGSTAASQPVWAKFRCHLSPGQLPEDATIRRAALLRRQVGYRRHKHPTIQEGVWMPYYEWSFQLTVATETVKPHAPTGRCGINLGYRQRPDGAVRVAYCVGDDGHSEELCLPPSLLARWTQAEGIQSVRDKSYFLPMRDALWAWLRESAENNRALPEWLTKECETLYAWKSAGRLARLYRTWAENRFVGDTAIFASLHAWRERDGHLEQFFLMLLAKAARVRTALYRAFASRVRLRYQTVVVDGTDYAELKRRPCVGAEDHVNATAKRNLQYAAPAKLRLVLTQNGAVTGETENITRKCHVCGQIDDFDRAVELDHRCSGCETLWDQDYNAAKNLLGGTGSVSTVAEEAGPGKSRWEKRKEKKKQKQSEPAVDA